uniref:Uncharacterized protein n=1 Tax=Panagrellus redivivus TaxID=6233 RepID=A0A7E4ULM1_PANRE
MKRMPLGNCKISRIPMDSPAHTPKLSMLTQNKVFLNMVWIHRFPDGTSSTMSTPRDTATDNTGRRGASAFMPRRRRTFTAFWMRCEAAAGAIDATHDVEDDAELTDGLPTKVVQRREGHPSRTARRGWHRRAGHRQKAVLRRHDGHYRGETRGGNGADRGRVPLTFYSPVVACRKNTDLEKLNFVLPSLVLERKQGKYPRKRVDRDCAPN